ncbi:hypothetical protein FB451DRAFT_1568371 [Mycena latifolia]|nr:hypothetical protein FB451DRAFT_1568371 [Mycena latifolia]
MDSSPPGSDYYANLFPDWNGPKFMDPRSLESPALGEWQRSEEKRLQPRDKAYIRFLHTHGVDEDVIVAESSWNLKTVRKAIANDYGKPGLKVSEAEAAKHVCAEFYERLRAIQARDKGEQSPAKEGSPTKFQAPPIEYAKRNREHHSAPLPPASTRNPYTFKSSPQGASTAPKAHRPVPPPDADDVFVHAFLSRVALDQEWFTAFRASGVTVRALRHVAKMPHDRADAYFARLAPTMTLADRLILVDALLDLKD